MKKVPFIISLIMNIVNIMAIIYVQYILLFGKDFLSIINLNALTTNELLYLNVIVFTLVATLISVIVAILSNPQKKISEMNLFTGVPKFLVVIEIIIFGFAVYNALNCPLDEMFVLIAFQVLHIIITCFCGGSLMASKSE